MHSAIALEPYVTFSVGKDIAPGMVDEYNHRATGTGHSQFHAITGNLTSTERRAEDLQHEDLSKLDDAAFDNGFNHFEYLQLGVDRLMERPKPGSMLFMWTCLA